MRKIKGKNTTPEILVRKFLFSKGLRFRIHNKKMIGKPDVLLPKFNTVIFVNGSFWHAHENSKHNKLPKSNQSYWVPKILGNAKRDKKNIRLLKELGWNTITIWECKLKNANKDVDSLCRKIVKKEIAK